MSAQEKQPYQLLTGGPFGIQTVRSFWAVDDNDARAQAGELPPGVLLVREVERASPGKGGRI